MKHPNWVIIKSGREYQVSDNVPGKRTYSEDFATLKEAKAFLKSKSKEDK